MPAKNGKTVAHASQAVPAGAALEGAARISFLTCVEECFILCFVRNIACVVRNHHRKNRKIFQIARKLNYDIGEEDHGKDKQVKTLRPAVSIAFLVCFPIGAATV